MLNTALDRRRRRREYLARGLMRLSAAVTGGLALGLSLYVLVRGLPHVTWPLLSTAPSYLTGRIGILPNLLNTLYLIPVTLAAVLPLGVGGAIYLNEYARSRRLAALIEYAAETLSGIPSIIYGLVGMLLCSFLGMKKSLLAGAMTLVVMSLPTVIRTTQESLKTIPQSCREGAFALGAGRWQVIGTVVLPGCAPGILTGCILSAGRILGESAALLFTAGFSHTLLPFPKGLGSPGATLSVALYLYAKDQVEFDVAFAIAAILLLICALLSLCAAKLGQSVGKERAG